MFLFRKCRDTFELLDLSNENANVGDYLLIEDEIEASKRIILQVVDISYVAISGELEEFVRISLRKEIDVKDYTSDPLSQLTQEILDAKLLLCKSRGSIQDGNFNQGTPWAPSRINSTVSFLSATELLGQLKPIRYIPVDFGNLRDGSTLLLDLSDVDGSLTMIIGRKGTGKSHLAKIILNNLVKEGAHCLVFDINNEYVLQNEDDQFVTLEPGKNLIFGINSIGKETFLALMEEVMELPPTSTLELSRIWENLKNNGMLTIRRLKYEIANSRVNDHVKDALLRRIDMLASAGIVSDTPTRQVDDILKTDEGCAAIILLRGMPGIYRKVVVGLILRKLVSDLDNNNLQPVFLFAEEAHLYQNLSFWEDLISRMRHIGLSPIFITNEPESFSDFTYRQADNLFIFNFLNDKDLSALSKISKLDGDSIIAMVRSLPMGRTLSVGNMTGGIPIVFDVSKQKHFMYGETKRAFRQFRGVHEKNLILAKFAREPSSS